VERSASPGSPRYSHVLLIGSTSIGSRARVRRTSKCNRRATNSDRRTSESSAAHHRAPPAHGPSQCSPSSTPHLPVYIRAQRSRELHNDHEMYTHVFLRQETTRRALESPYSGPYQVLSRRAKTLQLLVRVRPVTVSRDRVKPAYTLNGTDHGSNFNPPASTTPSAAPSATLQSPSQILLIPAVAIHFPARFDI
jgi:hypothetical protein